MGERETDWRQAPRWFLVRVTVISLSLASGVCGFFGSVTYWLVSDQIQQIRKGADDPKWDLLRSLAYTQGSQGKRLDQHEAMLTGAGGLQEQFREFRAETRANHVELMRRLKKGS